MHKIVAIIVVMIIIAGCSVDDNSVVSNSSILSSSALDSDNYTATVSYSLASKPSRNIEAVLMLSDDSYVFEDNTTTKTLIFSSNDDNITQSVTIKRNIESIDSYQDNFSKLCVQPTIIATEDNGTKTQIVLQNPNSPIIRNMGNINPTDYLPLSIELQANMSTPSRVSYEVMDKDDSSLVDIRKHFRSLGVSASHTVPVSGLYENHNNIVKIYSVNELNTQCYTDIYTITTRELLHAEKATMTIEKADYSKMSNTWVLNYGTSATTEKGVPHLYDLKGNLRFILDNDRGTNFRGVIIRDDMIYGLSNTRNDVLTMNFAGVLNDRATVSGGIYEFHHDFTLLDNGSYVVLARSGSSYDDIMVLIDPSISNTAVRYEWDMDKVLDKERVDLFDWKSDSSFSRNDDWLHQNSLVFDNYDNTLIASGRHQGVTKVTMPDINGDFELKWIISPHKGFNTSDISMAYYMKDKLLTPLDANGDNITDQRVLDGDINHADFEWPWTHHSAHILRRDGDLLNILLFDNGVNRNRDTSENNLYSRVVEYQIDEANMTIKQIWAHGKGEGERMYSATMSAVDYMADSDTYYMSSSNTEQRDNKNTKAIEVTKAGEEVFYIHFGTDRSYRTNRIKLYDYMRMPTVNIN